MNKYAYVTLLTSNSYLPGVIILYESLRFVKTKYPLICLITDEISDDVLKKLDTLGILYKKVPTIQMSQQFIEYNNQINQYCTNIWKKCFTKFHAFELTEYDKVIFCDADLMFLKNCDHCFEMPHMTAAIDGEYSQHCLDTPCFNAGFMVIKPEENFKSKILDYILSLDLNTISTKTVIADQEILNLYYTNWLQDKQLHLSKYYNIFPNCSAKIYTEDIIQNGYFIHFVGVKPWDYVIVKDMPEPISKAVFMFSRETPLNSYCLYFYELAYSMYKSSLKNNFSPLDWDCIINNGKFCYMIAECSWQFFKDIKTANIFIAKAVKIDQTNQEYLTASNKFSTIMHIKQYLPLFREAVAKLYENLNSNTSNYLSIMHLTAPVFSVDADSDILPYAENSINSLIVYIGLFESYILDLVTNNHIIK